MATRGKPIDTIVRNFANWTLAALLPSSLVSSSPGTLEAAYFQLLGRSLIIRKHIN